MNYKYKITVTRKDNRIEYDNVDRYSVEARYLSFTVEKPHFKRFIVPFQHDVIDIEIESKEEKYVPNGEFAGGE